MDKSVKHVINDLDFDGQPDEVSWITCVCDPEARMDSIESWRNHLSAQVRVKQPTKNPDFNHMIAG